jgi:hypothetical protein
VNPWRPVRETPRAFGPFARFGLFVSSPKYTAAGVNCYLVWEKAPAQIASDLADKIAAILRDPLGWANVRAAALQTVAAQFPPLAEQLRRKLEFFEKVVAEG